MGEAPPVLLNLHGSRAPRRGFTVRAVVLGLLLIPLNSYWVIQMELFRYSAHPTTVSLFFNAVFTLLVLQAFFSTLRHLLPRWAFSQAELLLIYSMVCIGSCMASHDFAQVLMPVLSWSFYAAGNPANKFAALINDHLPPWATVQDRRVYLPFYEGGSSLYRAEFILGWLPAVATWTGFALALVLVMVCLSALVRRQWLEHEHLACPLVRLPVEITRPRAMLWRDRLFWIGFAIAGGMDVWNSIAFWVPSMPKLPIYEYNLGRYIRARPWNAIGWLPRSLYPFVIGLGYLMPSDFLFSCWFFYWFWKMERVASAALGLDQIRDFPFDNFQCFGAYLLFALSALWIGRGYLREVGRAISGLPSRLRDREEPLTYRAAALGIVVGLLGLIWVWSALGMRLWVSLAFFGIYYLLAVAITRMRAQFGAPVHDLHFTGPDTILTQTAGTALFTQKELIVLGISWWFNRAYRSHPMPHALEGIKMQDRTAGQARGIVPALLLAALVGMLSAFWTMLALNYDLGAVAKGRIGLGGGFERAVTWIAGPEIRRSGPALAILVGFGQALFLEAMRFRYVNWPFHPLGFAISANWEMNLVWMPLMVAWIIKTMIIKYAGGKVYHRAVPLFLGLILGQFVVGSLVNIISIAYHVPSYMFWQ